MTSREVTLRLEAFDRSAQRLIASAQALADDRGSADVEPLHVLYRALEHSPLAQRAVDSVLADGSDLLFEAEALLRGLPKRVGGAAFLSPPTLALLQRAEALAAGSLAGVAQLLTALLLENGAVRHALDACAVHPQALRVAVQLAGQLTPPPEAFAPDARRRSQSQALRFVRELTPADHPIVGRDAELRRMQQVLARSAASHPLLVGEHGVGRRSLVQALAQLLDAGQAPVPLAGKRIVELDPAQLATGARLRGELEERAAQLIASLRGGDAILYVSDLDALLADRFEPVLDALSTALARSTLRLIAVAEPSALANPEAAGLLRHMVRIEVEPPSLDAAIAMLRASALRLEAAHGVVFDAAAIAAAAQLARRYVPSAQLPKSALDILDEAAAMQRIGAVAHTSEPTAITEAHVAEAVAAATGIPVSRVQQTEAHKLLALETQLGARVIGQDAAVRALADAIRRGRVGLRDAKRPIGSFLFLGSSGVGKTELAKALAELLFDDEHALTRLDMSEFMEKHTVSRLLGSPPGYADSEQGGFLTEAVRRRPYSVVLFDEIEKAHPDVFNVLLQVLDDGRLTDSRGRVAHFADTVIILTSNIGARRLIEQPEPSNRAAAHDAVMAELRATLRPELLNRIDELVIFEALGKPELARILELQLAGLSRMLAQRGVTLVASDAAKRYIVEHSYDPAFGARPLRRVIQQKLQDPLAQMLLESGESALSVDVDVAPTADGLVLRRAPS